MRRLSFAAIVVLLCGLPQPAAAVKSIRYERWLIWGPNIGRDTVAPIDTTSSVSFSFNATVTDGDLRDGFRFSLAEKDGASRDVLMRFTLAPCAPPPLVGDEVLISSGGTLYCDAGGRLQATEFIRWTATWCEFPLQGLCGANGIAALPSSSDHEKYELILLDENDEEGSLQTPEDGLSCSDGRPRGPALVVEAPEFAPTGSIGVYADSTGLLGCSDITPHVPFRWYVVAHLEGMSRCGMTYFDLRINGMPQDLYVATTPNPAASVVIGNPFSRGGLAFHCERGDGKTIVLYTLDGIATSELRNVELAVSAGDPSDRFWPHPWILLCPRIAESRQRIRGTSFLVNPTPGHLCDTTANANATWATVKSLYREPR